MELTPTDFMSVYIHKVVERRIEIRYDNNGQQVRIISETLVEEFNPCLIASLQHRIVELETQIKNEGKNRDYLSPEYLAAIFGGSQFVFEIIKIL